MSDLIDFTQGVETPVQDTGLIDFTAGVPAATTTPSQDQYNVSQLTVMDVAKGTDPAESFKANEEIADKQYALDDSAQGVFNRQIETAKDAMLKGLESGELDPAVGGQGILDFITEVTKDATSPEANQLALIDSYKAAGIITEADAAVEAELVAQHYLRAKTEAITAGTDFWDKAGDYFGFLAPFGFTKDFADLANIVANNDDEGFFSSAGDVTTMRNRINALEPAERIVLFDAMQEAVIDATDGNLIKAGMFLESLFTPESNELETEILLDVGLSAVFTPGDVLAAGKLFAYVAKVGAAQTSVVATAARGGNRAVAGQLNASAVGDAEAARGLDTTTGAAVSNSVAAERLYDPEIVQGVAADTIKGLDELSAKAAGVEKSLDDLQSSILAGAFEEGDLARAGVKDKRISDAINNGFQVHSARILDDSDLSNVKIQYNLRYKDTNRFRQIESEIPLTIDDVTGNYVAALDSKALEFNAVLSPNAWLKGNALDSARLRGVADDTAARIQAQLADLHKEAFSTLKGALSGRKRARVDAMLRWSDEVVSEDGTTIGRVLTPQQLRAGVDTDAGRVALRSDKEIEAYFKVQGLGKAVQRIQNKRARRDLQLRGMKATTLNDQPVVLRLLENDGQVGRVFDQLPADGPGTIRVYDERKKAIVTLNREEVEAMYSVEDVRLAKLHDAIEAKKIPGAQGAKEGEWFEFILRSPDDVSELPQKVLHSKPAYVPKVSDQIRYLVKQGDTGLVNGVTKVVRTTTLRTFSSKREADAYAQEMIEAAIDKGESAATAKAKYQAVADRQLTKDQLSDSAIDGMEGLFTGTRARHAIGHGSTGDEPAKRLTAHEAFARNLGTLAKHTNLNDWRLGEEQRWLNTAKEVLGAGAPRTFHKPFEEVQKQNNKAVQGLEKMRNQIKVWNGISTNEEAATDVMWQRLHDVMYDHKYTKPLAGAALWTKDRQLFSATKQAAYHVLLGGLSPIQLYVQAMGATVALSRAGFRELPAILANTPLFSVMDNFNDVEAAVKYAKATGLLGKGQEDMYRAWRNSGLLDSVDNNADLQQLNRGQGIGGGFKNTAENVSLALFRKGEGMNRRISYMEAYLRATKRKPGQIIDKAVLQKIHKDARLSMLELSRANAAVWQGGVDASFMQNLVSVALQFQQVATKTTELMLIRGAKSGGFTVGEKAKIIAGQALLLGGAGVPAGGFVISKVADAFGINLDDLSDEDIEILNEGAMGVMQNAMGGEEFDIASRTSLLAQSTSFWKDMFSSDVKVIDKLLGPSGSVLTRGVDAAKQMELMRQMAIVAPELSEPMGENRFLMGMEAVLEGISPAYKNILAYRLAESADVFLNSKGEAVTRAGELSMVDKGFILMGFKHEDYEDAFLINSVVQDAQTEIQEGAKTYKQMMWKAWVTGDTESFVAAQLAGAEVFARMYKDRPDIAMKIAQRAFDEIGAGETKIDKAIKRFTDAQYGSMVGVSNTVPPTLGSNAITRVER